MASDLFVGSTKIAFVYVGSSRIREVYKGTKRVWANSYTLTIQPTPADSVVTLTAAGYTQSGNSITVPYGTAVSYTVKKDLYATQTGSQVVTSTNTIAITLVKNAYPSGTVLFESSTAGTHNVTLAYTQRYSIIVVGGGGGGFTSYSGSGTRRTYSCAGGGSGALVQGQKQVSSGNYTIVVGSAGNGGVGGGQSSVFNEVAYGGGGATTSHPSVAGSGGSYSTTLSGTAGNPGDRRIVQGASAVVSGGASVYGGYGAGGMAAYGSGYAGTSGYVKIVAV